MQCLVPGSVRNPNGPGFIVAPCGKCPACRDRRIKSWVFRLVEESKAHPFSVLSTLTYSDSEVLWSDSGPTLFKPDLQNFIKRLRHYAPGKVKYYICGEYGTHTWRPHYHAILFGVRPDMVEKAWQKGLAHHGDVSEDFIAYTTKYLSKPSRIRNREGEYRLPEFALQSTGLGLSHLSPEMVAFYRSNMATCIQRPGGFIESMPRYYRDRVFTKGELAWMNYEAQARYQEDLDRKILEAGGADAYYHSRWASINYEMEKFHKQKDESRNKL